MAICVGCGLYAPNGVLEVQLCDNGGIKCATENDEGPGGCKAGLYVEFPANPTPGGTDNKPANLGCGINTDANGKLVTDNCAGGGILCGDITGDSQCNYVNVQGDDGVAGQTNAECKQITATDTTGTGGEGSDAGPHIFFQNFPNGTFDPGSSNPSPSCNGLVRTCQGLWAPPKIPSINFNCAQVERGNGGIPGGFTIQDLIWPLNAQAGLLEATFVGDFGAVGPGPNRLILFNSFTQDECLPIDAMSFTTFNLAMEVRPGERWRLALHERIITGLPNLGDGTSSIVDGWANQAVFFLDNIGGPGGQTQYQTVVFNDISTWDFPAGVLNRRMEAMVTIRRLAGAGPLNNDVAEFNFQYRNMGHGYHKSVPKNCGALGTP